MEWHGVQGPGFTRTGDEPEMIDKLAEAVSNNRGSTLKGNKILGCKFIGSYLVFKLNTSKPKTRVRKPPALNPQELFTKVSPNNAIFIAEEQHLFPSLVILITQSLPIP